IDWRTGFIEHVRIEGPDNATESSLAELVAAVLASPIAPFTRTLSLRGVPSEVVEAVPTCPPAHLAKLRLLVVSRLPEAAVLGIYRDRGIEVDIQIDAGPARYQPNFE